MRNRKKIIGIIVGCLLLALLDKPRLVFFLCNSPLRLLFIMIIVLTLPLRLAMITNLNFAL